MPAYFPVFIAGERVRIKPAKYLKAYLWPQWQWNHPVTDDQLGFAGEEANVARVEYFHGGTVLLRLACVPGTWHEECVEDSLFLRPEWDGYPNPSEYFAIEKFTSDGTDYVRVLTKSGVECLRKYAHGGADSEVNNMREVAALRHFVGFQQRFDFHSPFQPDSFHWQGLKERMLRQRFGLSEDAPLPNGEFTADVLEVLKSGIPSYPIRASHARFSFQAAQWSLWEREVSNPIDREEDKQIRILCNFYSQATPLQRQTIRDMAKWEWSLLHFAHRSAVRALRQGQAEDIRVGLIALSINDLADTLSSGGLGGNSGRTLPTLCVLEILRRTAAIINAPYSSMIESVIQVSSPYTAKVLQQLLPELARGFEIEEYEDENGKMIGWSASPRAQR